MKITASVEGREVELEIPDDGWAAKQIREAIGSDYSLATTQGADGRAYVNDQVCTRKECGRPYSEHQMNGVFCP